MSGMQIRKMSAGQEDNDNWQLVVSAPDSTPSN